LIFSSRRNGGAWPPFPVWTRRRCRWLRSWRRQVGQSIVGAMRRRVSLAMLLFAAVVVLPAMAHASPPDPSWVAGLWDDADYDDVVLAVTGMTAAPHYTPDVVLNPSPCVVGVTRRRPRIRRLPPRTTHPNDQTAPCDAAGRRPGIEMKPWAILASTLLIGLALGVGGTLLLSPAIESYLVSALRAPRRPVEGQVIGKQR